MEIRIDKICGLEIYMYQVIFFYSFKYISKYMSLKLSR